MGQAHKELAPATMTVTYEFPARGSHPPLKLVWYQGDSKPPQLDAGSGAAAPAVHRRQGHALSVGAAGPSCCPRRGSRISRRRPRRCPARPATGSSGSRRARAKARCPARTSSIPAGPPKRTTSATWPTGPGRRSSGTTSTCAPERAGSRPVHPASVPQRLGRHSELGAIGSGQVRKASTSVSS